MRKSHGLLVLALVIVVVFLAFVYYQYRATHGPGSIEVVMCPECKEAFYAELRSGGDIVCALYDVGSETAAVLAAGDIPVVTDDESNSAYGTPHRSYGLMHNKFCVINHSTVITGSYNPTDRGELNRNNLLIIESEALAENYYKEYHALETGIVRPSIHHTLWINDTRVENYFCPNDSCEEQVLRVLGGAQEEILFMTYSFTSDPIGDLLVSKRAAGVRVEGVCEKQQIDEHSECERLGARVWDEDPLMHHKVFIIDKETVVTGSYNPTASGTLRNRENILVIYSPVVAAQFLAEYASTQ